MTVHDEHHELDHIDDQDNVDENTSLVRHSTGMKTVDFTNSNLLTFSAVAVWATIGGLNCYLVGSFLMGGDVHF